MVRDTLCLMENNFEIMTFTLCEPPIVKLLVPMMSPNYNNFMYQYILHVAAEDTVHTVLAVYELVVG